MTEAQDIYFFGWQEQLLGWILVKFQRISNKMQGTMPFSGSTFFSLELK